MLKKLVTRIAIITIYLLIIVEDYIWTIGNKLIEKLAKLSIFKQLEQFLMQLPPYGALLSIALPIVLLFPINLVAIYLISHKLKIYGTLLLIFIKVVGTMIMARLFTINKSNLLSISWFKYIHDIVLACRNHAVEWLHTNPFYQYLKAKVQSFKRKKTFYVTRIRRHLKRGIIRK